MNGYHNLLERQVRAEANRNRMIFYTIIILSLIYLSISLVFGDMGLVKYLEMNRTRNEHRETDRRGTYPERASAPSAQGPQNDPFYREKLAREEYGLSKPDEYIFQYDR